jgi:hypothetical protein
MRHIQICWAITGGLRYSGYRTPIILDLRKFTLSHVEATKVFNKDFSVINCLGQASKNSRVSSAY